MKGYSEDFRLCIYQEDIGYPQRIVFLDNYDGIGLNTEKDLFEDRLHIKNNVTNVTFLSHDDWNRGLDYEQKLEKVTKEQFEEFIDVLCDSPFVRIDPEKNPDFYGTEVQGHLCLNLADGTQVELRLIDGGYVDYRGLGWIFVKMPGELFDAVLSACQ